MLRVDAGWRDAVALRRLRPRWLPGMEASLRAGTDAIGPDEQIVRTDFQAAAEDQQFQIRHFTDSALQIGDHLLIHVPALHMATSRQIALGEARLLAE